MSLSGFPHFLQHSGNVRNTSFLCNVKMWNIVPAWVLYPQHCETSGGLTGVRLSFDKISLSSSRSSPPFLKFLYPCYPPVRFLLTTEHWLLDFLSDRACLSLIVHVWLCAPMKSVGALNLVVSHWILTALSATWIGLHSLIYCGTLYKQVLAFPNVQWIQFITEGHDCRGGN